MLRFTPASLFVKLLIVQGFLLGCKILRLEVLQLPFDFWYQCFPVVGIDADNVDFTSVFFLACHQGPISTN